MPNGRQRGVTVWLIGLSGAGKSTIARSLYTGLLARGLEVEVLDADILRKHLNRDLDFSKEGRNENVRRLGFVAELLTHHGVIAIVAAIFPTAQLAWKSGKESAAFSKYIWMPLERMRKERSYRTLLEGSQRRDSPVYGIDAPYEEPLSSNIRRETKKETVKESTSKVLMAVLSFIGGQTSPKSRE